MKGENFVRVYDNCISAEMCNTLISQFEELKFQNATWTRQGGVENAPKEIKNDEATEISQLHISGMGLEASKKMMQIVNDKLVDYIQVFETGMFAHLADDYPVITDGCKIQKTKPSQGFHVWHCENPAQAGSRRLLTWILYLNDVLEGGETEFIHLSERIKPKAGRLVIFPAGFTHAHRGNPPLDGDKYIVTGWMSYTGH